MPVRETPRRERGGGWDREENNGRNSPSSAPPLSYYISPEWNEGGEGSFSVFDDSEIPAYAAPDNINKGVCPPPFSIPGIWVSVCVCELEVLFFCSCLWIWEENCAPWRLCSLAWGRRNYFLPTSNGNAKEKEKEKKEIFPSFLEAKRPKKIVLWGASLYNYQRQNEGTEKRSWIFSIYIGYFGRPRKKFIWWEKGRDREWRKRKGKKAHLLPARPPRAAQGQIPSETKIGHLVWGKYIAPPSPLIPP